MTSGVEYIKSWAGLLKIGQFITLLIAFSCLADFSNKSENNGSFKFFLFVTITAWLITMVLFVLFASGYYERVEIQWSLAMLIYSVVLVILLLISTSLVADKARKFRRGVKEVSHDGTVEYIDVCDIYDENGVPCSNVEAAAVFGFIALGLFLADAVFYFFKYRNDGHVADQDGFVQQDTTGTQKDRGIVEEIP